MHAVSSSVSWRSCNDVGLLSEEYDLASKRLSSVTFPTALSHVSLINSAHNVSTERRPGARPRNAGDVGHLRTEESRS